MDVFKDFINVNKDVMKNTARGISKNWVILFVGIVYSILNTLIYGLITTLFVGPLRIIAGFIGAFVSAAMISSYLYLLYNVINDSKITVDVFKDSFTVFIYKVYGVMFVFYIVRIFVSILGLQMVYGLITLLAVIFLNALPETIYQKHYDANRSLSYSFEFIKDNLFNWFLPNMLIVGLISIIMKLVYSLGMNMWMMPNVNRFAMFIRRIDLGFILIQGLVTLAMVYRGYLFDILSTSTRRKREFMSKF